MRPVPTMKTWSTIWCGGRDSLRQKSESNPESDGTLTHLVILVLTLGYLLIWVWMLGSLLDWITKIETREWKTSPSTISGCPSMSTLLTQPRSSLGWCRTTTAGPLDSGMMKGSWEMTLLLMILCWLLTMLMKRSKKCTNMQLNRWHHTIEETTYWSQWDVTFPMVMPG